MTQLELPFTLGFGDEDTIAEINRLVRELLKNEIYARMQDPYVDPAEGSVYVRTDTVLGLTEVNAEWSTDEEWLNHFTDIFYGYQCCDHMEDHEEDSDHYLILGLNVSVKHNGEEIGYASLGGVSLGWTDRHGGPDKLYLAQTVRDLLAEAL